MNDKVENKVTEHLASADRRRQGVNLVYNHVAHPYLMALSIWYRHNAEKGQMFDLNISPGVRATIHEDFHHVFRVQLIRKDGQTALFELKPRRNQTGQSIENHPVAMSVSYPMEVLNRPKTKRRIIYKGEWFNFFIDLYVKIFITDENPNVPDMTFPHLDWRFPSLLRP